MRPAKLLRFLAMALLAVSAGPAPAQQPYPNRPITIVVPISLGTGADILARLLGAKFAERTGASVVVENKPGAGGGLGIGIAARAPADGYTWLMAPTSYALQPAIDKTVPYDLFKSFAPVCLIATGTLMLAVNDSLPARSAKEYVALAKTQPGKLNYSSPGNGSPHHLAMELFKLDAGINVVHVPYKDSASATRDLTAGIVSAMILPQSTVTPMVKSGRVRVLAALGDARASVYPNVPTLKEEGFPSTTVGVWIGLMVPAATPPEIVKKLNAEMNAILALPDMNALITRQGMVPKGGSTERLGDLVKSDFTNWSRAIVAAKIKSD